MVYCPKCGFKFEIGDMSSVEETTPQNRLSEVPTTETDVVDEYLSGAEGVAIPKVSNYREKFKKHQLTPMDVRTGVTKVPILKGDAEMDKFGDLVVGEGLVQEF